MIIIMEIWVVKFQGKGWKIEKKGGQNLTNHSNYFQKVPNFEIQSKFFGIKNHVNFFIHWMISIMVLTICKLQFQQWYQFLITQCFVYSRVRNKHTPTLIIFLIFFQGLRPYSGLHRAYFRGICIRYKWGYACSFCQIF